VTKSHRQRAHVIVALDLTFTCATARPLSRFADTAILTGSSKRMPGAFSSRLLASQEAESDKGRSSESLARSILIVI
jgi:hypothetical protein